MQNYLTHSKQIQHRHSITHMETTSNTLHKTDVNHMTQNRKYVKKDSYMSQKNTHKGKNASAFNIEINSDTNISHQKIPVTTNTLNTGNLEIHKMTRKRKHKCTIHMESKSDISQPKTPKTTRTLNTDNHHMQHTYNPTNVHFDSTKMEKQKKQKHLDTHQYTVSQTQTGKAIRLSKSKNTKPNTNLQLTPNKHELQTNQNIIDHPSTRKHLTPDEKSAVTQPNNIAKQQSKPQLSPNKKATELQKNKISLQHSRKNMKYQQKPNQPKTEIKPNKIVHQTRRAKMTPEEKSKYRKQDIASKNNRLQTRAELMSSYTPENGTSHPAIQLVLKEFFKAIDQGPAYVCNCCHRFLYRSNILPFHENNFKDKSLLRECIANTSTTEQQWICCTCSRTLKRGSMPAQAVINQMQLEQIPPVLKELCHLERQLLCLILTFMYIVSLHKGAQKGIRGQVVLVPAKVHETVKSLPRHTSDSQIIPLIFKRRLTDSSPTSKQYIKPSIVNAAFDYLKQNNPHYKDIDENNGWVANSNSL